MNAAPFDEDAAERWHKMTPEQRAELPEPQRNWNVRNYRAAHSYVQAGSERMAREDARKEKEAAKNAIVSVSAVDFVREFQAHDYIIDGVPIQPGYIYGVTARTGHGKTTVVTRAELAIVTGTPLAGREVVQGRVLSLCGENPADKQARVLATCQALKIAVPDGLRIVPGSFPVAARMDDLRRDADANGPYRLVTVDTSAAYFVGEDENSNVEARLHASELRLLTTLNGNPAVWVLCHPVKGATEDNLLPRGGGAFLAEIDGNFTCWLDGDRVRFHWAGKLRGPSFEPIMFKLRGRTLDGLLTPKGKPVESVSAIPIDDDEAEKLQRAELRDENRLLFEMMRDKSGSMAAWARACGWLLANGEPQKSKVHRLLTELKNEKLVKHVRRKWQLTDAGKKEAVAC